VSLLLVLLLSIGLVGTAGGCAQGCPAALLEGVLVEQDGDLVVRRDDGVVEPVRWSASQNRVQDNGGALVVVDWLGWVKAREGDFVRLGGGEVGGRWNVCGMFEVGRAPAG
jgi:hypothetical protein